jgi:hypothetical protein
MSRVFWSGLLFFVVVGCGTRSEQTALQADLSPVGVVKVERAGATDPVIQVDGSTTVYVIQSSRVRALIERTEGGSVTVPLSAVDDHSGPLYYGTYSGTIVGHHADPWNRIACVICSKNALEPCCPHPK